MTAPDDGPLADDAGHGTEASFSCAVCGGTAGRVSLRAAGAAVDMGIGVMDCAVDGVLISRFLHINWIPVAPATFAQLRDLLTSSQPDAAAVHAIDWELAPFWCRTCRQSYCRDHWVLKVIMDEGFYDQTDGICPAGHPQVVDD